MTLDAWLKANGTGAANRLHTRTGLSPPVIARARKGRANLASATKISLATGRVVSIASMTADEVPHELEAPARKRKGARR